MNSLVVTGKKTSLDSWKMIRTGAFDLLVNDRLVATVSSKGDQRNRFVDVAYPLPADLAGAGTLTVKFAAKDKSRTASIYGVRLAKAEKD